MYRVTHLLSKTSRRLGSDSSECWRAATIAPNCPGWMAEHSKSKSTGGCYQADVSPCTESLISAHPPAQVDAIRDSSLARVLCENGDDIQLMQPLVFKAPTDM